jgi:hypothetical protein
MKVYRYPESQGEPDKYSPREIRDEVDLSSTSFYYSNECQQIPKARLVPPYNNQYRVRFDINSPEASQRGSALMVEISSQDLLCLLEQGLYAGLTSDEVSSIINILSKHLAQGNNRLQKENDKLQEKINKFRES